MNIIGIDPGKDGGIALPNGDVISMPAKKILVKPARYNFVKEGNKKVMIKSGSNKGTFKKKMVSKPKYDTELDCSEIYDTLICEGFSGCTDTFVIEAAGNSIGNAAKTTATTHYNIGKLHAISELIGSKTIVVTAAKWKGDLKLTAKHLGLSKQDIKDGKHKLLCTERAEELSGMKFRGAKGGIKDGQAEAWLIKYWYENFGGKDEKNNI